MMFYETQLCLPIWVFYAALLFLWCSNLREFARLPTWKGRQETAVEHKFAALYNRTR